MKIKYLAHASFLVTSEDGTKIVTDPYKTGGGIRYKEIDEVADIAVTTHEHSDHNNIRAVRGSPAVVKGPGMHTAKGIAFKGIPFYHDPSKGSERGHNNIFTFTLDGINVCFCGDLGHTLTQKDADEIGKVDLLFIPVGGYYTIDANEAGEVVNVLNPKVVIPMHYKTRSVDYPIKGVDLFLAGKENVKQSNTSEIDVKALPEKREIWVLTPSLL
jgi:L-ascorbate metabolism protein UlaG (beta-lactamase superfamily)